MSLNLITDINIAMYYISICLIWQATKWQLKRQNIGFYIGHYVVTQHNAKIVGEKKQSKLVLDTL